MILRDTEMKVLEVLWEHGAMPANQLYKILEEKAGWKKSTSYTVFNKCIEKGWITRTEPNFICSAKITKEDAQKIGISEMLHRFFDNSTGEFMKAFVKKEDLSDQDITELQELVKKLK